MTINHIGITVPKDKYQATLDFYLAALGPLGYKVKMQAGEYAVGLGDSFAPDFWITAESETYKAGGTGHVCFYGKSESFFTYFPFSIASCLNHKSCRSVLEGNVDVE